MRSLPGIILVIIFAIVALGSSLFTVNETERALVVRLGKLVTIKDKNAQVDKNAQADKNAPIDKNTQNQDIPKVLEPGLHLKIPFIDRILFFDVRLNMSEVPSARIVTKEKKDLIVDLFAKWRINDFALFYKRTYGDSKVGIERAEELLRQLAIHTLRAEFGQRTIRNVVSGERKELMGKLKEGLNEKVQSWGIDLIDIRIKRIDLPSDVSDAVYDRMRSERKRVATELRANGESKAEMIRAEADRTRRVLLAEAESDAKRIRGTGDAEAMGIYAQSFNKSPKFFEFYRSLEAYKNAFTNKQDVLVIKPHHNDFFKYFGKMELKDNP